MSLAKFKRRSSAASLSAAEREWFPRWVDGYRRHCGAEPSADLPMTVDLVIGFLQSLRDNQIPAWRRLQAARALELYQEITGSKQSIDFTPIKRKLHEISRREADNHTPAPTTEEERRLVAGEWNCGKLDSNEPRIVQRMRGRMRVLGYRRSTETAYVAWVKRFIRHVDDERIEKYGETEIADFLTELALSGHVTAGTQNQAISALVLLFEKVLGRRLGLINSLRAKPSLYLPVVLTRKEIGELLQRFVWDSKRIMFLLMYGSGLRHRE